MPGAVDRLRAAGRMPPPSLDLVVYEGGKGLALRDLDRVLALPERQPVNCDQKGGLYVPATQALVEVMTERLSLGPRACDCQKRFGLPCVKQLNAMQAWSLREMRLAGGLVARAAVGAGKTITGILAPMAFPDCKEAVIFIEPGQRQQYLLTYRRLAQHFKVPSLRFHDDDMEGYIVEGAPTLRVITYSKLSRGAATNLLGSKIQPDLIIADEGHRLANRRSSQTGRFLRYMEQYGDQVRFCVWSGTLVKKSICDQSHLAAHALGEGSPMPVDPDEMEAWGLVVDESTRADTTSSVAIDLYREFANTRPPAGAMQWSVVTAQEKLRLGYQKRVSSTLGIVSTASGSVDCSLYIKEKAVPKLPDAVRQALEGVRNEGVRPDGEVLVEDIDKFRCASEVACGFYYRWVFPKNEPVELIKRWFAARKAWNKELREKLIYAEEHMDSPMLCAHAAERAWREVPYEGDLPVWKAETWPEWAAVKDLVYHESRPVWIDEFMAKDAAEWALKNKGVVWYMSDAFGKKVAQLAGLPCHGGGPDAEKNILAEKGDRSVIVSFKAHGQGRDGLQRLFSEQYFPQFPTSGNLWEQGLGRLHRQGQEADEVTTWLPLHVQENRDAIKKAIREAEFIEQVTGNQQKLVLADKDLTL
jgi:hypothetical protein